MDTEVAGGASRARSRLDQVLGVLQQPIYAYPSLLFRSHLFGLRYPRGEQHAAPLPAPTSAD